MHERAGQLAAASDLINVDALLAAYYEQLPNPEDPAQRVIFGTSGHRGTSLNTTFNEAHIVSTTAAIVEYRRLQGTDGRGAVPLRCSVLPGCKPMWMRAGLGRRRPRFPTPF